MFTIILRGPGATSWDDAIFSARTFTSRAEEPALEVNFQAENIASSRLVVSEDRLPSDLVRNFF